MKYVVLLLVAVTIGATIAEPIRSVRTLNDDIEDFKALVPKDKIVKTALNYVLFDKEVKSAVQYLRGKNFKPVWQKFFAIDDVKALIKYSEESGLPVVRTINKIADTLKVPHIDNPIRLYAINDDYKVGQGVKGLIVDIMALVPKAKLVSLFEEKMQNSEEFIAMIARMTHDDFIRLVDAVQNNAEVRQVVADLKSQKIDIMDIIAAIKASIAG